LNWLDCVLLLVFAASAVSGLMTGLARLVVGLLAAVAGFVCGLWFYGSAGAFLRPYVSHEGIADFLGFLIIFLAAILAGAIIGRLLARLLRWVGLNWLDRLCGAAFGLVRALVIAIALVLALMAFSPHPPPKAVVGSRLAPYVIDAARATAYLAPRQVRVGALGSYEKIKEIWSKAIKKNEA